MRINSIDIQVKKEKFNKKKGVYENGEDDAYPLLVETLINASNTASCCVNVLSSFLYGDGFLFEKEIRNKANEKGTPFKKSILYINQKKETPNDLLLKIAYEISYYRGVFLHINYNALYEKTSVQVIPFKNCRLGKKDDLEYRGKIAVYDNWEGLKSNKDNEDVIWFDVYNPSAKVIQAQVEEAGGWSKYKGQVYFFNLDKNDTYPTAFIHSVLLDCESEYNSALFSNKIYKQGFLGKYLLFTKPIKDKKEREEFTEILERSVGVKSNNTIIHFEMDTEGEDFKKEYSIEALQENTHDKVFEYTDKKIANNIRKAFANIPLVLIDNVEGKLGGSSGEALKEAREYMALQTEKIRNNIEEVFEEVFYNFEREISPNGIYKIITKI